MPNLLLRQTPEQIQDYNRRSPRPFGILLIVNRLAPRDWRFSFTFHNNTTRLMVRSDPSLTIEDFRTLADGAIPEMFDSDEIRFGDEKGLAVQCSISSEQESNLLNLPRWRGKKFVGIQIIYKNHSLPPEFQNISTVRKNLYELTWFGSHFIAEIHDRKSFTWNLFGVEAVIHPTKRPHYLCGSQELLESYEYQFQDDANKHIGSVLLVLAKRGVLPSNKFYHSRFGLIQTDFSIIDWLPDKAESKCSALIEFNEQKLQYGPSAQLGPYDEWHSILIALEKATKTCCHSSDFERLLTDLEEVEQANAASELARRQDAIIKRIKVYYKGNKLGCAPESENEVVLLLAKLEVLGGLPLPTFQILEYTPRKGIDALGDFQVDRSASVDRHAPIEIEYYFENFLKHGHAVQQVRLIICWKFRSEATRDRLEYHKDWLYKYSVGQYSSWVIILAKLPEITERSD